MLPLMIALFLAAGSQDQAAPVDAVDSQSALINAMDRTLGNYQSCLIRNAVLLGKGNNEKAGKILRAVRLTCEREWTEFLESMPDADGALAATKARTADMTRKSSEESAMIALKNMRGSR
jgi:hypothetical protein